MGAGLAPYLSISAKWSMSFHVAIHSLSALCLDMCWVLGMLRQVGGW